MRSDVQTPQSAFTLIGGTGDINLHVVRISNEKSETICLSVWSSVEVCTFEAFDMHTKSNGVDVRLKACAVFVKSSIYTWQESQQRKPVHVCMNNFRYMFEQ